MIEIVKRKIELEEIPFSKKLKKEFPLDIWEKIFTQFLTVSDLLTVRLVCRDLNRVFLRVPVIKRVFAEKVLPFTFIEEFFSSTSSFMRANSYFRGAGLTLRFGSIDRSFFFKKLLQEIPDCETIYVKSVVNRNEFFQNLNSLTQLKTLTIKKGYLADYSPIPDDLRLNSLTSLSLSDYFMNRNDTISLLNQITHIFSLKLSKIPTHPALFSFISLTSLKTLKLKNLVISKADLKIFLEKNRQLESLTLNDLNCLSDQIDFPNLENLTQIKLLNTGFNGNSESGLQSILDHATRITELVLTQKFRSEDNFKGICFQLTNPQALCNLKKLILKKFESLSFTSLTQFLEKHSRILPLRNLELDDLDKIEGNQLKGLIERVSGLQKLTLKISRCTLLNLSSALGTLRSFKTDTLQTATLQHLFTYATQLQKLKAVLFQTINLEKFPLLTSLRVLSGVSSELVIDLMKKAPYLHTIQDFNGAAASKILTASDGEQQKFFQLLDQDSIETLKQRSLDEGNVELLKLLLKNGLSSKLKGGRSMLGCLLYQWQNTPNKKFFIDLELLERYKEMIFLLFRQGAKLSFEEKKKGRTLEDFATKIGDIDLINFVAKRKRDDPAA